jgi:hypothetical protein
MDDNLGIRVTQSGYTDWTLTTCCVCGAVVEVWRGHYRVLLDRDYHYGAVCDYCASIPSALEACVREARERWNE